jgi:hypothetical protein
MMLTVRGLVLCWSGLISRRVIHAENRVFSGIDRDGTFLDAGEAEGVATNGAVFTRIAWTDLPET